MKKNIIDNIYKNLLFQVTYFAQYVPAMRVIKNDCIIKTTDIQNDTFNMVLGTHFTQKNVEEKIEEVKNIFNTKNLPFFWWVGPNDTPFNLKEILISKGFVSKENDYGMYLDLEKYTPKKLDLLTIKQVSNTQELKEFCDIHEKTYANPEAYDIIFSKIPPSCYQKKSPFRFYTGYFAGKPVTTGALVFHADVVGIYFILTLKEERRKGCATEMMNHLLNIAKEENQKTTVLQASEKGKKVYAKMGFIECCVFQEFILKKVDLQKNILNMKNLDYQKITFRKAQKSDENLLKDWFNKPHVQEFWDNSLEMWQNLISYLNGNKILYDYWIGLFENKPYCLIITSDATDNDHPNAPGSDNNLLPYIDSQEKTLTIDFMIGEEAFLGRCLSYLSLNKFTDIQEGINVFIIDPKASNTKAIHVYEKAGFKKVGSYVPKKGFFSGLEHYIMKKTT